MNESYLSHHGILGMKWGVRRYRREDGSLTDAGKSRYYENGKRKKSKDMTTKELIEANNRLQLEQNYDRMTGKGNARRTMSKALIAAAAAAGSMYIGKKIMETDIPVISYGDKTINLGDEFTKKMLVAAGSAAIASVSASSRGKNK